MIKKQIYVLENPEVEQDPTERQSQLMFDKAEAGTRAYFSTYKQKAGQQWINEIKKGTYEENKDPVFEGTTKKVQEVGSEFVKLYKTIFSQKKIEGEDDLLGSLKKILKATRDRLDSPVKEAEVLAVMESLPIGKQAGPNRIPNGVYKRMSSIFAEKFTDMMNESRKTKKLPKHFKEGDISMLYKKGDRDDPRNYRPITLLNTDYKIYTRILAKRMLLSVHEFVSETQKGFVPGVFIAEATQLLRLVEAHINEEPTERQGIFLFLDMEKAFDRVSYEFINKGLTALGYGKNFRNWVHMMYDTEDAPRRRMYVNGYMSEWFHIKSGVAQGCPLSPLLFLIVAEAMKISIDMEKKIKGITIGKKSYKLSQFADDTTLLLTSLNELRPVRRAINRWCLATGMKENVAKREGLGMGKYKGLDLKNGIKWAPADGWCISLGVPIGNDLNETKWWGGKINKVRALTSSWLSMERSKYFGRNLLVQALYFGRLRYWAYTISQTKSVMEIIQKDADILRWARDPTLTVDTDDDGAPSTEATKNKKRIRRWVAEDTARGPRELGGLNTMDWSMHVTSFKIEWILRYLDPGNAAWKDIIDGFILYDKKGNLRYPEGRSIILQDLGVRQKTKILQSIPKGAKYLKEAFREFWKAKIKPAKNNYDGVASESPWYGHRFKARAPNSVMKFCKNTLEITQISDFWNKDTNRTFRRSEWRDWVEKLEERKTGIKPNNEFILNRADEVVAIQRQIPREIEIELLKNYEADPKKGKRVYLIRGKTVWPAVIIDERWARRYKIDNVGRGHPTQRTTPYEYFTVIDAHMWKGRWAGPKGANFALDTTWDCLGIKDLRHANISSLTRAMALKKFKKPASEEAWAIRGMQPKWKLSWRIKPKYTAPRDLVVWLKIQHRTLWVAKNGGMGDTTCMAKWCRHEESQLHLVECQSIKENFWKEIISIMVELDVLPEECNGSPFQDDRKKWAILLVAGQIEGAAVSNEAAAILCWAWRSLYAEVIKRRIEAKETLKPKVAIKNTVRMMYSRVVAYGFKWRRWWSKQRLWQVARRKEVGKKHQTFKLITCDEEATYMVSPKLLNIKDRWKAV